MTGSRSELGIGCNDLLGDALPIGTRIRFTKTLTSQADEFSPGNLYAKKGDGGEITGHGTQEGYWVKWDHWPHAFGASRDEFEPVHCDYCDGARQIETDNNGPIGDCPVCTPPNAVLQPRNFRVAEILSAGSTC